MPNRFWRPQRHGLTKLGAVYFPDFSTRDVAGPLDEIVATLTLSEQRELHLLLWVAAVAPRGLIRQLFRVEDETAGALLIRILGPLHIQIKGLVGLLYFAAEVQEERRGARV